MQDIRIQIDSRHIKPGDIFFALPSFSGRDLVPFVQEAFQKGAQALVVESILFQRLGSDIKKKCQVVPNVQATLNQTVARYLIPKPQTLIAVTGTNGKTSVVEFTRQFWNACGINGASIGTMGVNGLPFAEFDTKGRSTADILTLHRILQHLGKKEVTSVALEASSHGLHQKRLDGLCFSGAVFTNLSHDHLDYHQTERNYFHSKARLFLDLLPADCAAIICGDTVWGERLIRLCQKKRVPVLTYGVKPHNECCVEVFPTAHGQKVCFSIAQEKKYEFNLPFVGEFQALNVMAAFLILIQVSGVSIEAALKASQTLKGIKGRLDSIGCTSLGAKVFIDYAHTPDALKQALKALRLRTQKNLWVVFGCGGERDAKKRPVMGKIAQDFADGIILTDDNPRTENPELITEQILGETVQAQVIHDRKQAIETAVFQLKQGDTLLIAGKGHETGQIVGQTTFPFEDTKVALDALSSEYDPEKPPH